MSINLSDISLLESDAVWLVEWWPTFRRNIVSSSLGFKQFKKLLLDPDRRRQ
jgi:hypothetical protein